MIVVDIETSGLYPEKNGIWQIGALDFYNPRNQFLQEARIDDEDLIEKEALKIIAKTKTELRDKNKQSQKALLENFFIYVNKVQIKNPACQNPQFDISFVSFKARKYGLYFPLPHRSFDLHSIAQTKYLEIHGRFLIDGKENKSSMSLSKILDFCGMQDERIILKDCRLIKKGKPHNALEDAKLTGECLSRILYGKNLIEEYKMFPIPKYLKR